jgi:hypothetical protein
MADDPRYEVVMAPDGQPAIKMLDDEALIAKLTRENERLRVVAADLATALDAARSKAGGHLWPEVLVDAALQQYAAEAGDS